MNSQKKNKIFTLIAIFLVFVFIETTLHIVEFVKNYSKENKTVHQYTDVEKRLMELREVRRASSVQIGDSSRLSPDMYELADHDLYYAKPNTTIAVLINKRIGYMFTPVDDVHKELIKGFEGEVYYKHYDELSLRKTLKDRPSYDDKDPVKILVLADSFEGSYVHDEETFSARLEEHGDEDALFLKVYNSGVSGYNTKDQYYRLLELYRI